MMLESLSQERPPKKKKSDGKRGPKIPAKSSSSPAGDDRKIGLHTSPLEVIFALAEKDSRSSIGRLSPNLKKRQKRPKESLPFPKG